MNFWTSICRAKSKALGAFALTVGALVASVVLVGAWSQPVYAAELSSEEFRTFKELVKEGSQLRDGGEVRAALEKFEAARDILDHPKLTFNIGKLYQKIGACERARDLYTDVLARTELPDDLRVEVVAQLKAAKTCKSFGVLRLTCSPAQASVEIGSKSYACPLQQKVAPGPLELVVTAPGHKRQAVSISIAPGQLLEQSVQLQAGEDVVAGGDTISPPGDSGASSLWMTYTAYGSMGVGVALLAGGLASDYSAQSRAEAFVAVNNSGDRERAQELKSEAENAQLRTLVLYSAGAVFFGGGIALWAIDAQDEGDGDVRARTEIGWGAQGPTVRGVLEW